MLNHCFNKFNWREKVVLWQLLTVLLFAEKKGNCRLFTAKGKVTNAAHASTAHVVVRSCRKFWRH
jgi:hypothetical protein